MNDDHTIGSFYRQHISDYSLWENTLLEELRNVFVIRSNAVPMDIWEKIIQTPTAIRSWVMAFTHVSEDYQNNYEYYEKLGDKILDSAFNYMLLMDKKIFDTLKQSASVEKQFSDITQIYTAKVWLRENFQRYFPKLRSLIRVTYFLRTATDIMEDVFESMIFALQRSVDLVAFRGDYIGPGFVSVCKFVQWFYSSETKANEEFLNVKKNPKSFLKEFMEIMDFRYEIDTTRDEKEDRNPVIAIRKKARVKNTRNPFEMNPLFPYSWDSKLIRVQNDGTLFEFDLEEYSKNNNLSFTLDKTTGGTILVNELLNYLKMRYPELYEEKEIRDRYGYTNAKTFQMYGIDETSYNQMIRDLSSMGIEPKTFRITTVRETVIGEYVIAWGIDKNTMDKKKQFDLVVLSEEKKDRNRKIGDAINDFFGKSYAKPNINIQ